MGYDESPKQLIGAMRQPIQLPDGTVCYDFDYVRNGVGNIFMAEEALAGKRAAKISWQFEDKDTRIKLRHFYQNI